MATVNPQNTQAKGLYGQFGGLVDKLCPTLADPVDCGLSGSSVHGILHARILEWVAMPPPGDLPNPGMEPRAATLQANSLPPKLPGKPRLQLYWFILVSNFCYF